MKEIIKISHLTKDYGENRGIFDLSFEVKKGEFFGFVGTNGSGKTTTIRHMMGFLKANIGKCEIKGLNAYDNAPELKKYVGYVPGEIAFPDLPTGTEFLKLQAELEGVKDTTYVDSLISRLQLDITANPKRMSKGMKQKTAIVASLISNPEILILDEPTTGLDPLMRLTFIDILREEKEKGKTIFMSSHMYEELEAVCDRVALIKDGRIVDIADMNAIRNSDIRYYKLEFIDEKNYNKFKKFDFEIVRDQQKYNQTTIRIQDENINTLLKTLNNFKLKFMSEIKYDLKKYFNEKLGIKQKEEN